MNFFDLRCPNCKAELEPVDGVVSYICPYCKSRIMLDKQSDGTLHARLAVKQMEHESEERDKEFKRELIRERIRQNEEKKTNRFFIGFFIFCLGMLLLVGAFEGEFTKKIKVPYNHSYFENLNWQEAEKILDSAGFRKISCIPVDKKPGLFKDDGQVMSVSIDGNPKFKAKKEYPCNVPIIINYYPDT